MKIIGFYLFYGFVRFLSFFPLRWLYAVSSLLYPLIYYIIPYRKKLVFKNLRNSFPEKSENEITRIAKKFYRHFCDSFFESMVGGFLSGEELFERFKIANPELCNDLYNKKKSISLLMVHYGNWEWSSIMPWNVKHVVLPIYKPLRNKYFDNYFKKNREKFGCQTVAMEKILRVLTLYRKEGIPTMTYFIGDQRPRWAHIQHWIKFLNQDTPVILGAEKISKKFCHAVIFLDVSRVKRGYYEARFHLITDEPENTSTFEITEKYYAILEERIRENPEYWLWTHKRWKHEIEKYVPKNTPPE